MLSSNEQVLLAFSILSDGWLTRPQLVRLGRALGQAEATVRSALYRAVQTGWLDKGPEGLRLRKAGRARVTAEVPTEPWNGRFLGVAFTVAEDERKKRDDLRSLLRKEGFASLGAGLMILPDWPEGAVAERLGKHLHEPGFAVLSVEPRQEPAPHFAARVFPMDEWDREARLWAERWERHGPTIPAMSDREALAFRVQLEAQWLEWRRTMPLLPKELCLRHANIWRAVDALQHVRARTAPLLERYASLLLSRKR